MGRPTGLGPSGGRGSTPGCVRPVRRARRARSPAGPREGSRGPAGGRSGAGGSVLAAVSGAAERLGALRAADPLLLHVPDALADGQEPLVPLGIRQVFGPVAV